MKYKIMVDSCGELTKKMKADEHFASIPLSIVIDDHQIVDDEAFDQADFLKKVKASPNAPKSSCPSPECYREAFDCGAEHIYAVTLSAELSGSYNSAELGKKLLLEKNPNAKVHVFNSCSASIGQTLIALKIQQCEEQIMDFDQIVETVEQYRDSIRTFFVLESLDTLMKSGRLTGVKAFIANALNIKPVMGSTQKGTITQVDQARGIERALKKLVDNVSEAVKESKNKVLAISHCNCKERAELTKKALMALDNFSEIIIVDMAGISSMYANEGGVIVAG